MTSETLARFVRERDAAFAASLRGTPAEEIASVETEHEIRLPGSYVDFLRLMGRDSGDFSLFGAAHTHSFDDLRSALPDAYYPVREFFRIACPTEEADISALDYFLDLRRSDGSDSPIVMFQETDDFSVDRVKEQHFTFNEWMVRQLFTFLVLNRAEERSLVVVGCAGASEAAAMRDDMLTLLGKMKFQTSLDALQRVVCLQRGAAAALVSVLAGGLGVGVGLGSRDREELEVIVDQFLVRYPTAAVRDPRRPQGM